MGQLFKAIDFIEKYNNFIIKMMKDIKRKNNDEKI